MTIRQVPGKVTQLGVISIIVIVVISYTLFFYLQNLTENNIKNRLFNEQKQKQLDSTRAVSQHISSDLDAVMARLEGLANTGYLQNGLFSDNDNSSKSKRLMEENYQQINTIIDRLFLLDKNNIVKMNLVPTGQNNFLGTNSSDIYWIRETQTEHKPIFSNGYVGRDGKYRIGLGYPILNRETREYLGLVGAVILTETFFAKYGNIHNINSQFLVVYDRNATLLAVGASKTLVGKNFFGDYVQKFVNHNSVLNTLTHNLLNGNSGVAVYNYGRGERINTDYPIYIHGEPTYFIQVVTPTASIYSQVNDVLSTQRLETFALLAGTTAAVIVLIIFLIKWNSTLDNEVKRRTNELDESNRKLELANEQLKVREKAQQEFINVAAHELKTPIQPIVSLSDILLDRIRDGQNHELINTIFRSAKRLQRLSQDILDITRIESGLLNLSKEPFNLKQVISCTIDDYENQIKNSNKNVRLAYRFNRREEEDAKQKIGEAEGGQHQQEQENLPREPLKQDNGSFIVEADKGRITQVIDNLLSNAIKFTNEGTVSVLVESNNSEAIVSVKDNGQGIDPDILPRLFTKFASRSEMGGTGLGLFICKSIVEAHGGRMWAENNKDGKGATFSFSLSLANNNNM
jgi:signal transduction histidine kinase